MTRPLLLGIIIAPSKLVEFLEKIKAFAIKYDLKSLIDSIDEEFDEKYYESLRNIESRYPEMKECMIRAGKIYIYSDTVILYIYHF